MNIVAQYMDGNTPALGLTPVISAHTLDGTLVVSGETMSEIANGFYYYNFTGYSNTEDYVFMAYESSLSVADRYVVASNETDSLSNQGFIQQILGLSQTNFVMSGQTYDASGRLLTSDMYTYPTSGDTQADTNRNHEYDIACEYDANGNLIKYSVIER